MPRPASLAKIDDKVTDFKRGRRPFGVNECSGVRLEWDPPQECDPIAAKCHGRLWKFAI